MKYFFGATIVTIVLLGGWYLVTENQSTGKDANASDQQTETITIATSFYPLEHALERLVGDQGTVVNIGAGKDPHEFTPTTKNMVTLQQADMVVLQGADFEPWGDDIVARLEADNVPVVLATTDLELRTGGHEHNSKDEDAHDHDEAHGHEEDTDDYSAHEDETDHDQDEETVVHEEALDTHTDTHEHGNYDPHTWLSPTLFSETVTHLTDELVTLDPANEATYQANAATLQADLDALDAKYKNTLSNCMLDEVITSHDAFGYVAGQYNFTIHSLAGLSTQDTPSAQTLAILKEEAEEGIGAILLEQNSIAAYGETLARETNLQTLSINPISYAVAEDDDYITLMEQNLTAFATALECNE